MSEQVLNLAGIRLDATASSKEEAVGLCGQLLFELGAVESDYLSAMWQREQKFSSFMGNGVAMPHGTDESRKFVKRGQIVFLRLTKAIIWDTEPVNLCIGIAAREDEHGEILGNLAEAILDEEKFKILNSSNNKEEILQVLITN